jgi:hypothetical protein
MPFENPAMIIPTLAKARVIARKDGHAAGEQYARQFGGERAWQIFVKGPIAASNTGDSNLGLAGASAAYAETMRSDSAAVRLVLDGIVRRGEFNQRYLLTTSAPSASAGIEGHARAVSRLVLDGQSLTPQSSVSMIAVTAEMLRQIGNATESLFNKAMKSLLAEQLDRDFFATLVGTDTDAPIVPSSGPSASNALADLRSALLQVNSVGTPQLAWVLGVDAAKMAASLGDSTGSPAFTDMSATGGTLLNTPALVSSGVETDAIYLISGGCILANLGLIETLEGRSATIEMSDTPAHNSSTPTGSSSLVSMYQTNTVAIRGTIEYGVLAFKPGAVAKIENVNWGGA